MYTPSRQRDSLLLQKSIIRNTEGYTQYTYTGANDNPTPMQYYFHKDHLGNVCAVWNAMTGEVVQRTNYYPSGMPMAQSTGQSVQPLKYNAHEYIETHGYDTYDYGFRGYYATIGRFTSIDPLCERTPWQSPYAYANNNWINQIDILGLAGSDAYTTQDPAKISKLLDFLADGGSLNSFDFDEEGWTEGGDVSWWLDEGILLLTDKSGNNNYIIYSHGEGYISEITVNANNQYKTSQIHSDAVNVEVDALSLFFTLLEKQSSVFRELKYSKMFTFMSALQLYDDVNHFRSEPNARNGLNIIKDALSIKSNSYILMAVLTIDIDLWLFDVVSNQIVQLDNQLNDMNYWGDIYLNGY